MKKIIVFLMLVLSLVATGSIINAQGNSEVVLTTDKQEAMQGDTVTIKAEIYGTEPEAYEYSFYVMRNGQKIILGETGTKNECQWTPVTPASYEICVDAVGSNGGKYTESIPFEVKKRDVEVSFANISPTDYTEKGGMVTIQAQCGKGLGNENYQFYVIRDGQEIMLQNYTGSSQCVWHPVTPAEYTIVVQAKDQYGNISSASAPYVIKGSSLKAGEIVISNGSTIAANTTALISTTASGGSGSYEYEFYVIRDGRKIQLQNWSKTAAYNWTPYTLGSYQVYAGIRDSFGNTVESAPVNCSVIRSELEMTHFAISPEEKVLAESQVTLEAEAQAGYGGYQYWFYVVRDGRIITLQDYSESQSYVWTPVTAGDYTVHVEIKDAGGNIVKNSQSFRVDPLPFELTGFRIYPEESAFAGTKVALDVSAAGGVKPYQCQFYVIRNGEDKILLKDFSESLTYQWSPYTSADYEVYAILKDAWGNQTQISQKIQIKPAQVSFASFTVGNNGIAQQEQTVPISVKVQPLGNTGSLTYKFYVERNGEKIMLRDFGTSTAVNWTPVTPADYRVYVEVKDANGNIYQNYKEFKVIKKSLTVKSFTMSASGTVRPNTKVTLKALGSGGKASANGYQYKFYVIRNGQKIILRDFSYNNTYVWTPYTVASYSVRVCIKDSQGLEVTQSKNLTVSKTGWFYENGYKFYYKNGVKQTNLDGILPKQSSYEIRVNKKMNVVTVYAKDGNNGYIIPVKAFVCSTGQATPIGTFYTPAKYRWQTLIGPCYGQWCTRITGGILFHSVYYNSYNNNNTLSVSAYNKLGTTCSHGCVRLTAGDAKWIYNNCKINTKVIVYSSSNPGPFGKPTAYKLASWHSWDPTDPNMAYKCRQRGCH